ncbi:MAG: dihydropteroate synthase [Acidimicrobiales bacterium]
MLVRPLVMGIVNVTPDSFSDGGQFFAADDAIAHGLTLVAEGAAVIDVGGASSRPGATPVDEATEVARVLPVVAALATHVRVSVDTTKAAVAHAAIDAGATLVNDIGASLAPVAAERGVGWVAMHMQGEPGTMQAAPHYADVVAEVTAFLATTAAAARHAGVDEIWIDPGIGFGKSAEHNWALLGALGDLVATGWPVLVGASRKAFLGSALAAADGADGQVGAHDRLEGSVATATWAALQGVAMVRAHDVGATVAALDAVGAAA